MTKITVRGPMEDGLYYLGYKDDSGNFFLINKFSSFNLACLAASKMIGDRVRDQRKANPDGFPPA